MIEWGIIGSLKSPLTPIMSDNRDTLYTSKLARIADFAFDEKVATVFPDMIARSVPGYSSIISSIGLLAREHVWADSDCYDLGCSLGDATLAMRRNIRHSNCRIIAVDKAPAMIERCQSNIDTDDSSITVDVRCENIEDTDITNASLVVLNFTLQFIRLVARPTLIQRIYRGLLPGGILLLSEKLAFEDTAIQQLQTAMYHNFKRANGYSALEISQKRDALENVLIPETLATHKQRLHTAGFASGSPWFQCFNFASLVAIK